MKLSGIVVNGSKMIIPIIMNQKKTLLVLQPLISTLFIKRINFLATLLEMEH